MGLGVHSSSEELQAPAAVRGTGGSTQGPGSGAQVRESKVRGSKVKSQGEDWGVMESKVKVQRSRG